MKAAALSSETILAVGEKVWEELDNLPVDAIGGMEDDLPLITAACAYAALKRWPVEGFIIKRRSKGNPVEGFVFTGNKVALVASCKDNANEAAQKAHQNGLNILKVLTLEANKSKL